MWVVESPCINSAHTHTHTKIMQTEDWFKCTLWSFAEYIMSSSTVASALGILQYSTIYISEAGKC